MASFAELIPTITGYKRSHEKRDNVNELNLTTFAKEPNGPYLFLYTYDDDQKPVLSGRMIPGSKRDLLRVTAVGQGVRFLVQDY